MAESSPQSNSLTDKQNTYLVVVFRGVQYLSSAEMDRLAKETGLTKERVQKWFQNNRDLSRRKHWPLEEVPKLKRKVLRDKFLLSLNEAKKIFEEKSANNPTRTKRSELAQWARESSLIKLLLTDAEKSELQDIVTQQLKDMIQGICSSDQHSQLRATQQCRKYTENNQLSMEHTRKVMNKLVNFLDVDSKTELQLEAAWVIKNITSVIEGKNDGTGSCEQIFAVVVARAVKPLVKLLHPCTDLTEPALFALGNIVTDCSDLKNHVIEYDVVPPLCALVGSYDVPVDILRKATWLLSILCYEPFYGTLSPVTAMKLIQPVLVPLLGHPDLQIVSDACQALSYLTEGICVAVVPGLLAQVHASSEPEIPKCYFQH